MATYVMSDIHGEYEKFMELLRQIDLKSEDKLYVLGDVIDRGKHSMKILFEMMKHDNIVALIGNHELMAIKCLKFLHQDLVTGAEFNDDIELNFFEWEYNGADPTIDEFISLDSDEREKILQYMYKFVPYKTLNIDGQEYILVHAGPGRYFNERPLSQCSIYDLVWDRPDYSKPCFANKIIVCGHTPTQLIEGNNRPGYIFKENNYINLDCGASMGGKLAAFCLETRQEYYAG